MTKIEILYRNITFISTIEIQTSVLDRLTWYSHNNSVYIKSRTLAALIGNNICWPVEVVRNYKLVG